MIRRFHTYRGYPPVNLDMQQAATPSQYQEPSQAFDPSRQPDIEQFAKDRKAWRGSAAKHHLRSESHVNVKGKPAGISVPPQSTMTEFSSAIVTANKPQILIQGNLRRVRFVISNMTGATIFMSWKNPSIINGIPITTNGMYAENGNCSIDDIWITGTVAGKLVGAWEGVFADEANNIYGSALLFEDQREIAQLSLARLRAEKSK